MHTFLSVDWCRPTWAHPCWLL